MAAKKKRRGTAGHNFWIRCTPRNKRKGLSRSFKKTPRLQAGSTHAFPTAAAAERSLRKLLPKAAKGGAKSCSILTLVHRKGRGKKRENPTKVKVVKTMGVF